MFDTLLGAQADILGSEGGSKTFAKQANDAEIQALMTQLFELEAAQETDQALTCLLYTSPSPRDGLLSRMPSSA